MTGGEGEGEGGGGEGEERLRDALQGRRISIFYKELTHHEIVNNFIQSLFNCLYIYTMNKSNCTIIS
jgi:hypothetical protein